MEPSLSCTFPSWSFTSLGPSNDYSVSSSWLSSHILATTIAITLTVSAMYSMLSPSSSSSYTSSEPKTSSAILIPLRFSIACTKPVNTLFKLTSLESFTLRYCGSPMLYCVYSSSRNTYATLKVLTSCVSFSSLAMTSTFSSIPSMSAAFFTWIVACNLAATLNYLRTFISRAFSIPSSRSFKLSSNF